MADTDGLHQLILFTTTPPLHWGSGFPEVEAWRGLAKEERAVVDFRYERDPSGMIQSPDLEKIHINALDTDGNVLQASFNLVSISPYHYATLEGHTHWVFSVLFSPDGRVVASGSYDNTMRLWDVATGKTLSTLLYASSIVSMAFSPDGTTVASGLNNGNVLLSDVATGRHITTLRGHTNDVRSVAFSPDGSTLASGSYDNTVKLWDVSAGNTISTLVGHTDGVQLVLFAPDGKALASRSRDKSVRLWDTVAGTRLATLPHSHPVSSVSFSPDGTTLASGADDNNVRLWAVATGELIDTFKGHARAVSSVSFSPNGKILASGSFDNTVRLWRADEGMAIATLRGHESGVTRLLFSPDGTLLASAAWDHTVKVWDVTTGASLATFPHTETAASISFSPDGRLLATSENKTVELWDLSTWTLPRAQTVKIISGDNQEGASGAALADPLIVEVRDQLGEPISGAQVTFTVIAGDGSFSSGFTTLNAKTGPDGRAQVLLTLGPNPGPNTVRASIAELVVETFNAVGLGSSVVTDNALDYPTWHLPRGAALRLGKGVIGQSDRAIAFSPDGKLVGVASGIGVWLYSVEDPEKVTLLRSDLVNSLSFSPDGRTLASAGGVFEKEEIKLWDVATRTSTRIANGWYSADVTFSPDGRVLAYRARDGSNIELWDLASGTSATTKGSDDDGLITSLTISPDGATLASGFNDGKIKLWDMVTRTYAATLDGHPREVHSVAFTPDGNTLASASSDGTVRLWDPASGTNVATLRDHGSSVISIVFSPDGSIFATGAWNGDIKLWHTATLGNFDALNGHGDLVRAVSFSPNGNTFATGSIDGTVKLWDLASGNATTISGHSAAIFGMAFTPDGSTLASYSSSLQGKVEIWDVATGRLVAALGEHRCSPVETLAISPDGTTLATGSQDRTVRLWDLHTHTNFATLEHDHKVWVVSFSPDGRMLASAGGRSVNLWNVRTQDKIAEFNGLRDAVTALAFSPDGATLASGLYYGEIRVWDLLTGTTVAVLAGSSARILSLSFSSDGTRLTSGSYDDVVRVWDLVKGSTLDTRKAKWTQDMAFSSDGTMFATGSGDRMVRLYDMSTGDIVSTFGGHAHWIHSVVFSPDGNTLASGSNDGTILLWDLQRIHSVPYLVKGVSGIEQKGPAGTVLAKPFVVSVRDENGEPYAGAVVTFVVTAGGGTLSVTTDTTDASGKAGTTLTLGTKPGTNTVVATVADLEPLAFTAIGEANPDYDGDGKVGFGDFLLFVERFGLSQDDDGYEARYDLDGNGEVGFSDFLIFAGDFGKTVGN